MTAAEVVTFVPLPGRSVRVACSECGAAGYGPAGQPHRALLYPWQEKHVDHGHTSCPDCGKRLARLRTGTEQKHPRCPKRVKP